MDNINGLYNLAKFASEYSGTPPKITILDASQIMSLHHAIFPPDGTAIVVNIKTATMIDSVLRVLLTVYPRDHHVYWINTQEDETTKSSISIMNILQLKDKAENICLIIPSLGERTSFDGFHELIAHLRSPEGCPWDREQTHLSLRPNLLEETYETLSAIDNGDPAEMQEEFGDLLLQVVLQTQIASEAGEFKMSDVIRGIYTKLVDRHPHVFGDMEISDAEGVKQNWEKIKAKEREAKGEQKKGVLDGIPAELPALTQADAYQKRAARVGVDWPV
ncbi:MAG: MazG family protein, partial [Chloroflexota bacterium]